jgi:hypothetical protein
VTERLNNIFNAKSRFELVAATNEQRKKRNPSEQRI